ncbi:TPA: TlpA family protein disulfide reductase [Candidatus Poribacteria bacterium]|nr:TlpA family protein disulfide reductase [Candidatus Poribacteria bacterium]
MRAFILIALFCCSFGCSNETDNADNPSNPAQDSNSPLAPDFTLLSTDFKPVSLSDYRGKIVLLDFWATWCKPCQEEIPIFIDLYDQYRDQGFEMVGISIDSERLKVVNPFIEKLGVNYTILLGEPNLMDKYNIMAIPTAVLIDQSGNIRKRFTGAQLDRLIYENELKKLL